MQNDVSHEAFSIGLEQSLADFMAGKERQQKQVDAIKSAVRNPRKADRLLSEFVEDIIGSNPMTIHRPKMMVDPACRPSATVHIVKLGVRRKPIAINEIFTFESPKISRLEARMDAEKAAREAGYPIVGYLHSIERL
jgi:hypothetical protein